MGYEEVINEARSILASGEFDAAQRAGIVLLTYAESTDERRDKGMTLLAAAQVSAMRAMVSEALEHYKAAEQYLDSPQDRLSLFIGFGVMLAQSGNVTLIPGVLTNLASTLATCAALHTSNVAYGYATLARLQLAVDDHTGAENSASIAVSAGTVTGNGLAEAFSALSMVHEHAGRVSDAMNAMEDAMVHMTERHCLMEAQARYAQLALLHGDTKSATMHLRKAVEFPDFRDRIILAKVLRVTGQLINRDPKSAAAFTERLAAFLENSSLKGR